MSFTSEVKPAGDSSLRSLMAGGRSMPFFFWLFLSAAQADTDLEILEAQLGMAITFVSELDAQAGRCRDAGVPSAACSAFRLAINAEALTHYQSLCEPLIRWRDEMITQRSESDRDVASQVSEEADRKFQMLLELEARCGNRALTLRTEHVMAAYALSSSSGTTPLQSSQQGITKAETQRNKLLDVLADDHDRLRAETADLWRRLQVENAWRMQQQLRIDLSNPSLQ